MQPLPSSLLQSLRKQSAAVKTMKQDLQQVPLLASAPQFVIAHSAGSPGCQRQRIYDSEGRLSSSSTFITTAYSNSDTVTGQNTCRAVAGNRRTAFSRRTGTQSARGRQCGQRTLAEPVLEAPRHVLEIAHAPCASGLPADGLLAPLVCAAITDPQRVSKTERLFQESRHYQKAKQQTAALAAKLGCSHLRIVAAGKPHDEHLLFWMWNERRPQRLHSVCVLFRLLPARTTTACLSNQY